MTDRKEELAAMCRLEIRRTVTLALMSMSDYAYHLSESILDAEIDAMCERLTDKSVRSGDVPLLRELVIEDLWPRLREAHRQQRENVFRTISPDAEFAFDIGWAGLLQDAVTRIQTYPASWRAHITGGKEKLGCCVIYIDFDGDQPGARSEIERLREEVRLRSLATCEICGSQGRLRLGGYAKTVCDKHAAIFEGFREDDGIWADPWKWHEERPIEHHIDDVVGKSRALMAAVTMEMDESTDPTRRTALGRRIDDDIQAAVGRERELLTEYGYCVDAAVRAARSVVDEQRAVWIAGDIERWDEYSGDPLSESDRDWLLDYVLGLVAQRDKD